jgi:Domain of unknown function (DUF4145)
LHYSLDQNSGKCSTSVVLLECSYCQAIVDAKEIAEHEFDEIIEGGSVPWNSEVTLTHCPKCNEPLLAYQEDWGQGWDKPVRLYPHRDREFGDAVPKDIARAFSEARMCFRVKAFTAAAIMCRKTLEGICSVRGIKSGTLADKLKELKDKSVIENRLFEWAEALRTMGNEAAHGVESIISPEDAKDTLEFTEALIEYVFTYRDKFEEFKKRRVKAASSPKKAPSQVRDL